MTQDYFCLLYTSEGIHEEVNCEQPDIQEDSSMKDFEEEIKKFHPSLEIGEVEEAIYNHDLTDLTDLLVEIEKSRKADKNRQE